MQGDAVHALFVEQARTTAFLKLAVRAFGVARKGQLEFGVSVSGRDAEVVMLLSLPERERLMIYTAAKLAQERRERGLKLNLPEATALITSFLLEGARDGRTKADLQDAGRRVLRRDEVMDGVAEMLSQVHVEATFPDGTKLIAVQEPIQ